MESEIASRPWFAGSEFSAADIQMSYPIEAAAARVGLAGTHPALADWLTRIHARAAYRRALEVGGTYSVTP
jgi:glutathione S-transferase